MGEPEALNTQAHSEQPKPRKRISSIHKSLRGICFLGSVCDTYSSSENVLGGDRQGEETSSKLMCSYVTNRLSAGISSLAGSRVGSHRSLYARDVLRYVITFVMRVRGGRRGCRNVG